MAKRGPGISRRFSTPQAEHSLRMYLNIGALSFLEEATTAFAQAKAVSASSRKEYISHPNRNAPIACRYFDTLFGFMIL